jgi:hypothetical protein
MLKVYIDANVIKFSATKQLRIVPKNEKTRNWYGKVTGVLVNSIEYVNPNDWIQNTKLKKEAYLLMQIAKLAKQSRLQVVMNLETKLETWGLPRMASKTGEFYGAHIKHVDAPIKYERIIMGLGFDLKKAQYEFMKDIPNKRFLQLQKEIGAYQGKNKTNHNQLLDAYHIWCAEHNQCDFFLTLDFKLIKIVNKSKSASIKPILVTPSELLDKINL